MRHMTCDVVRIALQLAFHMTGDSADGSTLLLRTEVWLTVQTPLTTVLSYTVEKRSLLHSTRVMQDVTNVIVSPNAITWEYCIKRCTIPIYLWIGDAKRADDMHSCGAVLPTVIAEVLAYNGRRSTYFLGFMSLMLPEDPRMSKSIKWNMSLSDKYISPPEFLYCIPKIALIPSVIGVSSVSWIGPCGWSVDQEGIVGMSDIGSCNIVSDLQTPIAMWPAVWIHFPE